MKYPLHDLNCDDFENLVVLICHHILGSAVIPFAKGKDGGKDGKFCGKANRIPSESAPWDGNIVIQAKHTTKVNASCSDSAFTKILDNEVLPAVMLLKTNNEIDYYILFTNRSLTGIRESSITKKINEATGIPTYLVAEERIQMYLKEYPDVVREAELNHLLLPFEFDESDIRDIIVFLHDQIRTNDSLEMPAGFEYPGLDRKNELNNLSKNYFDDVIKKSVEDFDKIRRFLSDAINQEIAEIYADAVSELNAKIVLKRDQFYEFEQIIETCYDNLVRDNADILKGKKKLVRTLLHYMYCNCDIGIKE